MPAKIIWRKPDGTRLSPRHCPAKGDHARFSKNHPQDGDKDLIHKIDALAPAAYAATVAALRAVTPHNQWDS